VKGLKPEYKKVSELKPHCPNCKERLEGNNSTIMPYQCSCGVWIHEYEYFTFEVVKK